MINNKLKLLSIVGVIVVALVIIFFAYNSIIYRTAISEFEIKANLADTAGIAPNTTFVLKSTVALTTQVLEKYIKIIPETLFRIEKVSAQENTYTIIPNDPLQTDQVYTIQIDKGPLANHDFSWAYQVKAPFQITSSVPGDKGVDVPSNTGIEIYFNRNDIINPQNSIEINPKVTGKFEVSENMVRFIPYVPLADRTIYTITIKSGLRAKGTDDALNGDKIIQFQTSQTYSNIEPSISFSRKFAEFKPDLNVVIGMSAYNTTSVSAAIYKFNSAQEYIDSVTKIQGATPWARFYGDMGNQLTENKKVFTGSISLETQDYTSLLRVPQSLPAGYYAIVAESGKSKDISWFQVNPIASFVAFASSKSLIWLKNIDSGKSVVGASVTFSNKEIGQTGSDGVVLFETPQEMITSSNNYSYDYSASGRKFLIAKIPSGDLVIPVENEYGYAASLGKTDKWWNYISLNKNIYLPSDTLRFWAIQKLRSGENFDSEINVKLTNPYWSEDDKGVVTYAETNIKPSEYNAVTGELSFTNLKTGIYDLTFRRGSEIIGKQTVTISSYIKPAYKITATPDKNTMFAGDSVTFKVKAEFFDSTPVTNTILTYSAYGPFGSNYKGNITLNSQGEASFTIIPKYSTDQTYWPSYLSVNIQPLNSEEGVIQTSSSIFVFGPHISNSIIQKQLDSGVSFSVKTRMVVLDGSNRGEPYWNSEDYLGDPVVGVSTDVNISEMVYTKNQTGTSYDPINKLTYPIYDYKEEDHFVSSQTLVSDRSGSSEMSFVPENKKTYKITFTAYDGYNRVVKDTRYVYGGFSDFDYSNSDSSYYLANADSDQDVSYKIGDQVNLQLQTYQGAKPPEVKGGYIFIAVNNGNIEYKIQDTPKYSTVFEAKDIPNVGIWPGWFSNGRFHNSYLKNISFDANERRLNISVSKDKETYKPGETVKLDVKVVDKNNKPVKAEVNLSALDEAVFSIRTDESDVVNNLYRDIYSTLIIRTSNMPPYGGGGAERGGGDGDTPRSNIQEMAIYKSITTDGNGYAHVEFKLPDNITSWRLTSQAVTKDLFAGKNVSFIPVTLPFFIDATLNNTYLAGDELVLRLRTFGVGLTQGITNYKIESPTLAFNKIVKTGGDNIEASLGTLTAGIHQLTVSANNGVFSDALVRTLKVLNTYFTKNTSDLYLGVDGLKITNNAVGYTTLAFSSYGQGRLYNELKSLTCQCGLRIDQKGASIIATNLLNTYFAEKNDKLDFQASKYQSYTGGLQLLPYSSDDLELSAITANLFNDSTFDKNALKNYFTQSLNDKKSDISRIVRALYGLSSFKEPVLTKIENIKNDKALTSEDRVFVALALDSIGAKEEARSYYIEKIKPLIENKISYSYISGLNNDNTIITTALTAALTAKIDEPESAALALYVEQNHPRETLENFERLLYIKSILPKLSSEEISFTYNVGGNEEVKTLKNGEIFNLTLSPQEMSSFALSKVKGNLGIVASYEQESSPSKIIKDSNLSLTRIYEVNNTNNSAKEFKEGDLVKVRLIPSFNTNSLDGAYQIVDYLPSGLRPADEEATYGYDSYYGYRIYPTEISDQKVTFIIGKNSTSPIYYYARVVSKGTYKAEPAILQSLRSLESTTISNEDTITIK